jgi:hypothetical protein
MKFNKYNPSFLENFKNLVEKYKNLNINYSDCRNIEHFQLEQEGFEALIEKLKKDPNDYDITLEDFI